MLNPVKSFLFISVLFILNAAGAADLEQILKSGKLRAAITDTQTPPFVTLNKNKEYQGFEIEFLRLAAKAIGVKLELIPCDTYDAMIDAVVNDKADLAMSQISRTPKRMLKVLFTNPYVKLHLAMLVNRQEILRRRGSRTLDAYLRNYNGPLTIRAHTSHAQVIEYVFPRARLQEVSSQSEVEAMIDNRKLVAYFDDQITIRVLMQNHPGSQVYFQRIIFDDTTDNICIAVQPHSTRLCFILNCFLEQIAPRINRVFKSAL